MPRTISLARQVLTACFVMLALAPWSFSQSISVTPRSLPPTEDTLVSGTGFSADAAVDIYFDTEDLALATTDENGSFSQIAVHVPRSALPARHWISAVDRVTGASAQAAIRVQTPWLQFNAEPTLTGYNRYENVLSPATVGSLGLLWKFNVGQYVQAAPSVANGVIYGGSGDGNVYALSARSGALLWQYNTGSFVERSSPAIAYRMVYVGSGDGTLHALSATTGALLWKFPTGSGAYETSPTVANGVVYFSSDSLYALNAITGALLWQYPAVWSSPAVVNGVAYAASNDGNVCAVEAKTGILLWQYNTGSSSPPAVANGVVHAGSWDGNVYALNARSGTLLWKHATASDGIWLAVANGVVYAASSDSSVYALEAKTGTLLWQYNTGAWVASSPAVANGVVYVSSASGSVYALNARNGALLWSYYAGASGAWPSPLAVADGMVFFGTEYPDNRFYAFGLRSAVPGAPLIRAFDVDE